MQDPSGLIFLNARYYDPCTGRFITQDTVMGDLLNPLSPNLYAYCGNNPVAYIDPSGNIRVCQWDDLASGLKTSVGDTLQDLLNSPQAIVELIRAIESGQLSLEDLGQALGSALEPLKYIANNSDRIWIGNPTDLEVYEYGRNLGSVIQAVAGGAGGVAAAKILTKTTPRLAKVFRSTEKVIPVRPTSLGQGFDTFNALKKELGGPGEGNAWHHIVEQSQIGKSGFRPNQIHNTNNVIAIDEATHAKISGYYSSKQRFTGGQTVRDWLADQSYEKQHEFGMKVLRDFGVIK